MLSAMLELDPVIVLKSWVAILCIQVIFGQLGRRSKQDKPDLWSRLHLQRRTQHFLSGMLVLFYQRNYTREYFLAFTIGGMSFILLIHFARLHVSLIQTFFVGAFKHILREPEKSGMHVPGAVYFLLGNLISFWLFPRNFCSLTIIAVAVGDPLAGICGVLVSSPKILGNKTLAGTVGCALFTGLTLIFAINWGHIGSPIVPSHVCEMLMLLGACGAISELFSVIDDNLTMPILFRLSVWACLNVLPTDCSLHGLVKGVFES